MLFYLALSGFSQIDLLVPLKLTDNLSFCPDAKKTVRGKYFKSYPLKLDPSSQFSSDMPITLGGSPPRMSILLSYGRTGPMRFMWPLIQ